MPDANDVTLKRITQEQTYLQRDPLDTCSVGPTNDNDPRHWTGILAGPPNTPYAQGTLTFTIDFPENYPSTAFELTFETPIFHPNISTEGVVWLAELEGELWSPACTVRSVMVSLQAMLSDPEPLERVLNDEAARLCLKDMEGFREKARVWTEAYAVQ